MNTYIIYHALMYRITHWNDDTIWLERCWYSHNSLQSANHTTYYTTKCWL